MVCWSNQDNERTRCVYTVYAFCLCLDSDAPQEDKNKHIACTCANTINTHAVITHCVHMHSPSFSQNALS